MTRLQVGGETGPTYLVAASDATEHSKNMADLVCNGTADEVDINLMIAALPATGGTIILSEGAFILAAGITVSEWVCLVGQGHATQIDASGIAVDAITVASGTNGVQYRGKVEGLRITLAAATAGDGIATTARQATHTTLRDIYIDGGDGACWGITLEGITNGRVDSCKILGASNGLRVTNAGNNAINVGNVLITDVFVLLSENSTTGFYFEGDTNGICNLCAMIKCQVNKSGTPTGTTGFYFGDYVRYMTLMECDAEYLALGYQFGTGTTAGNITANDCWSYGCTTEFAENISHTPLIIIGGNGDFLDYQSFIEARPLRISVTGNLALSDIECGAIMNTDSAAAATTYTLTLPAADNDRPFSFTIMNTQVTGNAIQIAFVCAGGDNIMDDDGTVVASLTSTGVRGDSLTLQGFNYQWWRAQDKIGTWA